MSAPTIAVEWLLARAAVRATGLLHVVSRRDSGALNPVCGANPIRSREIEEHASVPAGIPVCADCTAFTSRWGGVDAFLNDYIGRFFEAPVADIDLRPGHARREPGDLTDLTASVAQRGVIAPVVVRRRGDRFEIIDGARRVAAAHVAGLATVPAIVREASDVEAVLDGLIANVHHADLNPIDLAHAYQDALPLVGGNKAELGRRLGVSREQVSNTIRLLALPEEDQQRLAGGQLTAEAGRALLRGPKPAPDPQLDALADLLTQVLEAKVAIRTRGATTEIVLRVPTADRDRVLAQLAPAA